MYTPVIYPHWFVKRDALRDKTAGSGLCGDLTLAYHPI